MQKGKFHCTPLQMEGPQLVSQAFHMATGTHIYASKIHKMNTEVSSPALFTSASPNESSTQQVHLYEPTRSQDPFKFLILQASIVTISVINKLEP